MRGGTAQQGTRAQLQESAAGRRDAPGAEGGGEEKDVERCNFALG